MDTPSVLDEMVNEDSVQVLKAAIPYLPASGQSFISIFAKFLELQNTIQLFHSSRGSMRICAQSEERTDPLEMLTACSKVCHGPMKERLDNMINTLVMLQMLEFSQKPLSAEADSQPKGAASHYES